MKTRVLVSCLVTSCLVLGGLAATLPAAESKKPKKPSLDVRASPRFAFSPANILFVAELQGGDDVEEYYCPELEWDWDDGGKSVTEADCPPFEAGSTKIQRRFTADHDFRRAGLYKVKVLLRRSDRLIATKTLDVTVRPGLGDPSFD